MTTTTRTMMMNKILQALYTERDTVCVSWNEALRQHEGLGEDIARLQDARRALEFKMARMRDDDEELSNQIDRLEEDSDVAWLNTSLATLAWQGEARDGRVTAVLCYEGRYVLVVGGRYVGESETPKDAVAAAANI